MACAHRRLSDLILCGKLLLMNSKQPDDKFPAPVYAATVLTHNFADGQKYFFVPLMHIHYAHCLMLEKQAIITRKEAKTILRGLDKLDLQKISAAKYDGSVEDLYFYVERELGLLDRKSTRLNSSHPRLSRMPSSA